MSSFWDSNRGASQGRRADIERFLLSRQEIQLLRDARSYMGYGWTLPYSPDFGEVLADAMADGTGAGEDDSQGHSEQAEEKHGSQTI